MKSKTTGNFWRLYKAAPDEIQAQARDAFQRWLQNPHARGLRFKRLRGTPDEYSVRIGKNWRAVGYRDDDTIFWYWIGAHDDYDRIIPGEYGE